MNTQEMTDETRDRKRHPTAKNMAALINVPVSIAIVPFHFLLNKKILSVVLACCLLVALLPITKLIQNRNQAFANRQQFNYAIEIITSH